MVAGVEFLPDKGRWEGLSSVRRHGDFLFLRYASGAAVRAEQQGRRVGYRRQLRDGHQGG
jgi:hypothetical protein